jgi:hypothetical protein
LVGRVASTVAKQVRRVEAHCFATYLQR